MNRTTRAVLSPVVGVIVALGLIWGLGSDMAIWKVIAIVVVGAGVVSGLNFAWDSNPWAESPEPEEEKLTT